MEHSPVPNNFGIADDGDLRAARSMLEHHIHIRANLPRLLAKAIRAGYRDEALAAMLAWGEGQRPLLAIWQELSVDRESLAGVAGR